MRTNKGELIDVIDPGLHNSNAGPDFFNAKIKIDGMLWVGNIEIHDKASDWFLHGHDKDSHYDNVILHVVGKDDMPVVTSKGEIVRQMQMDIPDHVSKNYAMILQEDKYPPCHSIVPYLSKIVLHSWMSALQAERLEGKTMAITERLKACNGSWEDAYFITLARNFGFGVNSEAFEAWAHILSLPSIAHHRDDIFQIEAIFLRLRPQNFPHIRISQLANLYYNRNASFSQLIECESIEDIKDIFSTHVTPYWETHYSFGRESKKSEKNLSKQSINVIILNTVIPVLFAYGRYKNDERYCERSLSLLEKLKAEDNSITRMWQECGMDIKTAADSQAIVQLKKEYCDRRDCLRCRIGYEFIKESGWFVKES